MYSTPDFKHHFRTALSSASPLLVALTSRRFMSLLAVVDTSLVAILCWAIWCQTIPLPVPTLSRFHNLFLDLSRILAREDAQSA